LKDLLAFYMFIMLLSANLVNVTSYVNQEIHLGDYNIKGEGEYLVPPFKYISLEYYNNSINVSSIKSYNLLINGSNNTLYIIFYNSSFPHFNYLINGTRISFELVNSRLINIYLDNKTLPYLLSLISNYSISNGTIYDFRLFPFYNSSLWVALFYVNGKDFFGYFLLAKQLEVNSSTITLSSTTSISNKESPLLSALILLSIGLITSFLIATTKRRRLTLF